jgi:4-phosphopantoate---beta-alanine ligase
MNISRNHPRFLSLSIRERLAIAVKDGIMAPQGLIAHGRGEAFDYLLGEKTTVAASKATRAAAALLLTAEHPILSVNGNTAALVGREIIRLSHMLSAPIEVNLFHRTRRREYIVAQYLKRLGAREILGTGAKARMTIRGVASPRRETDLRGIGTADTVLVPLEDGDRAEALERAGKRVIAIDLNPLSRTSQAATVSVVDNVVRAVPGLILAATRMRGLQRSKLVAITGNFDNEKNLANTVQDMIGYLRGWARD